MSFADAARALRRIQLQGGSLGNRDRRALRGAWSALAATPPEVVKPIAADRALSLLTALLHAEPELEKVVLHPAQLTWLVAFLDAPALTATGS